MFSGFVFKFNFCCFTLQKKSKVPLILIGNKCDLEREREVSFEKGQKLSNQWNEFYCNFFETSAKDNINLEKAIFEMIRQIDLYKFQETRKNNLKKEPKKKNNLNKCRVS